MPATVSTEPSKKQHKELFHRRLPPGDGGFLRLWMSWTIWNACYALYPLSLATLDRFPLLSLRDIFPRPGEVSPQGDAFGQCLKLCRYR